MKSRDISIWKTVTLGKYKSIDLLREAFAHADCKISLQANNLLNAPGLTLSKEEIELDLVKISLEKLGLKNSEESTNGRPSLKDIRNRVAEFGLAFCPAEVGPVLRIAYTQQPPGETLKVGMELIKDPTGYPGLFTVLNGNAELWLAWSGGGQVGHWHYTSEFVLCKPR